MSLNIDTRNTLALSIAVYAECNKIRRIILMLVSSLVIFSHLSFNQAVSRRASKVLEPFFSKLALANLKQLGGWSASWWYSGGISTLFKTV